MQSAMQAILAGALLLFAVLAVLNLIRGFRRYLRTAAAKPPEPEVEVNPPLPVVKTAAVELVGWVAIIWSLANLAILVMGAMTLQDRPMLSSIPIQLVVMAYVLVGTILVGWGGIMLLKLHAYGRRIVAWGIMLFGVMGVLGVAVCLFVRQQEDALPDAKALAIPIAVVLVIHLAVDTAIGVSAQHVGVAPSSAGG